MPEDMGIPGGHPADEYGQAYMVKDLLCVMEALGDERPILVGASMGGGISLIAIGESHVDAAALVLVDMAPHIEAEGARRIQAFMEQQPAGFDTLQEVADALAPARGGSMALPSMCAAVPMASITSTGSLPGAVRGAISFRKRETWTSTAARQYQSASVAQCARYLVDAMYRIRRRPASSYRPESARLCLGRPPSPAVG